MHKFSPSAGFLPRQSCFPAAHHRDDDSIQVKDSAACVTLLCSVCPRQNLFGLDGRGYMQHLVFHKKVFSLGESFNQLVPPSVAEGALEMTRCSTHLRLPSQLSAAGQGASLSTPSSQGQAGCFPNHSQENSPPAEMEREGAWMGFPAEMRLSLPPPSARGR